MAYDEYFCPHCGAILNNQCGFDPDGDDWTCTECGQTLYGDNTYDGDIYPGVMWYCDSCGTLLNKQKGFVDYCGQWRCVKCGFLNNISEDDIYESKEDYYSSKDKEDNDDSYSSDFDLETDSDSSDEYDYSLYIDQNEDEDEDNDEDEDEDYDVDEYESDVREIDETIPFHYKKSSVVEKILDFFDHKSSVVEKILDFFEDLLFEPIDYFETWFKPIGIIAGILLIVLLIWGKLQFSYFVLCMGVNLLVAGIALFSLDGLPVFINLCWQIFVGAFITWNIIIPMWIGFRILIGVIFTILGYGFLLKYG